MTFKNAFTWKKEKEPSVISWTPTDEYLISEENLTHYVNNSTEIKPVLRNIFLLAGYDSDEAIRGVIKDINVSKAKQTLEDKLNAGINTHLKKVWKDNNIEIKIDLESTRKFSFLIKDTGEKNRFENFSISDRSAGARHFLSLILSLSIVNSKEKLKNELILIDEPEMHLHPSGIGDLGRELLEIGKENYVFIATHSPLN